MEYPGRLLCAVFFDQLATQGQGIVFVVNTGLQTYIVKRCLSNYCTALKGQFSSQDAEKK